MGWLCYLAGLQTESVSYYKIALELNSKAIEPKFGITYPLDLLGNKNELKAQYETIINMDSQNTIAHYKMGVLNYGNKDVSGTIGKDGMYKNDGLLNSV